MVKVKIVDTISASAIRKLSRAARDKYAAVVRGVSI
jgi:hypothetical protein